METTRSAHRAGLLAAGLVGVIVLAMVALVAASGSGSAAPGVLPMGVTITQKGSDQPKPTNPAPTTPPEDPGPCIGCPGGDEDEGTTTPPVGGGGGGSAVDGFLTSGRWWGQAPARKTIGYSGAVVPYTPDSKTYRWNGGSGWQTNYGRSCAVGYRDEGIAGGSWSFWTKVSEWAEGTEISKRWTTSQGQFSCLEPAHWRTDSIECPSYAVGKWRRAAPPNSGNPPTAWIRDWTASEIAAGRQNVRQWSPFETSGRQYDKCFDQFVYSSDAETKGYGQWELRTTYFKKTCSIKVYTTADPRTGRVPPTEVTGCNGARQSGQPLVNLVQVWCDGHSFNWNGNHSFTTTECTPPPSPACADGGNCPPLPAGTPFGCFPQSKPYGWDPTFAGRSPSSRQFQVLDDGEVRNAWWRVPEPWGFDQVYNNTKKSRLKFLGGTPVRLRPNGQPEDAWGQYQPFVADYTLPVNGVSTMSKWVTGWKAGGTNVNRSTFPLAFMKPGTPGEPWKAIPEWYFKGKVPVERIEITGVRPNDPLNPTAQQLIYRVVTSYVTYEVTCPGLPMSLEVFRARTTSH